MSSKKKTTSNDSSGGGNGPVPGKPWLPYDWQSTPVTEDTDAACEQVLRDMGRGRR